MWSEAEMLELEEARPVRRTGARSLAGAVRVEIAERNVVRARGFEHELTRGGTPTVIYAPEGTRHGNFVEASYRRIMARPEWSKRLTKAHTAKRQAGRTGAEEEVRGWRELDAATSSDALLMNVFCYPRVPGKRLTALLGVERDREGGVEAEFGVRAGAKLERGLVDRTEIDMRLGGLLVEAKLTEGDFGRAPMRMVERYVAFAEVFEREALEVGARGVVGYQLVRGVLAAEAAGAGFCVMCDGRRRDLVEEWYGVMRAVRSCEVRSRLRLVTWQEIAGAVPEGLRGFLGEKYGIVAG